MLIVAAMLGRKRRYELHHGRVKQIEGIVCSVGLFEILRCTIPLAATDRVFMHRVSFGNSKLA